MKKIIVSISAFIFAAAVIFTACNFSTAPVQESEEDSTQTLTPVTFDDDFIRGFDASAVDSYDIDWYNTDGTQADFFKILAAHGVNTVRLRIWNDPSQKVEGSVPDGDNTLERTLRMAKSAKAAGLDLMLDFHYSDTWADPSKQIVPAEWKDLTSVSAVEEALADYTKEVLNALKDINCLPEYVQVGNEINNGILRHDGYSSGKGTASSSPTFPLGTAKEDDSTYNYLKYLAAGCDAVREVSSDIKIVLHVASSSSGSDTKTIAAIEGYDVDYDIIGLSYYPWESSHGTISDMQTKVSTWKSSYNKNVVIAECSGIWNYSSSDTSDLEIETSHMIDPDTGSVYSDLTMDSTSTYITGSIANQKAIVRHIMDAAYDAGACGVFTWGGETRGSWKWAMFTWGGVAMDSLDAFNYTPGSSSDENETEVLTKTLSTSTYTADGNLQQVLTADNFSDYSITKITVSASDIDWGSSTEWRWIKAYSAEDWDSTALTLIDYEYDSSSTDESSGTDSLTTSDTISEIKTNGLYLAGLSGMTCTITIEINYTN